MATTEEGYVLITCDRCDAREEVAIDKDGDPAWSEIEADGWYFGASDTVGTCGDCNGRDEE